MAQFFPKWTNLLVPAVAVASVTGVHVLAIGFFWYYGSPKYTDVGYSPEQPVEFSHKLHAGELGMDCRYCHTGVERSQEANVPSTQTCMNCHRIIHPESAKLEPVRESYRTNKPIEWIRVHKLGEYAYFDHSVHIRAGVGCASCHGKVTTMERIRQMEPLSMGWCLSCHRKPQAHIRPIDEITSMRWKPSSNKEKMMSDANKLIRERHLNPPEDCSACHR